MRSLRVATVLLLTVVALAAAFTLGPLRAVTTHGASMQPRISPGDLVVVAPSSSYTIGDVAAYRSALLGTTVLHRIVGVDGDRYVFQGDSNSWLDPERPTEPDLVGKQVVHLPGAGLWLSRLTSPPALAAYTFLLLISGGSAAARTRRQRRKERPAMTPRRPQRRVLVALGPYVRPLAAAIAALGVTGAAVSGVAWTRPVTAPIASAASLTSTMDFSYLADVPTSAAYDGTTVTAPSPVFRTLTDALRVTYRYAGDPASLTVAARVSSENGWSTTVPLAREQTIGDGFEGSVRLDLDALEERADAAAAVIGLPADGLTVAVLPHVAFARGGTFTPSFELSLDEHVLKPTGAQTVNGTTDVTATRPGPAQLSALGRSVAVSTARVVGPVALGLALLSALALAVAARAGGASCEADRVRRRYGALLLPVLPIALAAGRPVVDVPDVDALARLAERYGLLVLHWSRSGVDTYVVQDEATTYRCRSDRPGALADPGPAGDDELPSLEPDARSWAGMGNGIRGGSSSPAATAA